MNLIILSDQKFQELIFYLQLQVNQKCTDETSCRYDLSFHALIDGYRVIKQFTSYQKGFQGRYHSRTLLYPEVKYQLNPGKTGIQTIYKDDSPSKLFMLTNGQKKR